MLPLRFIVTIMTSLSANTGLSTSEKPGAILTFGGDKIITRSARCTLTACKLTCRYGEP